MTNPLAYLLLFCISSRLLVSHAQISVSTCDDLNSAIDRINDGEVLGEIQIPQSITITMEPCGSMSTISANVSIVGIGSPAPIITGVGKIPLFDLDLEYVSLTLKNIVVDSGFEESDDGGCLYLFHPTNSAYITSVVFQNCFSNRGGAIFSLGGLLVLNSVQFISNTAKSEGGAIFIDEGIAPVIRNSIFSSNKVTSNTNDVYGGAISSYSPLSIFKSSFSHNSAIASSSFSAFGGAVYVSEDAVFTNSSFSKNFASSSANAGGGAIYEDSEHQITSNFSKFENNYVSAPKNTGIGGAIGCDYCTIYSSFFSANNISALSSQGGAVSAAYFGEFYSSSFTSNKLVSTGRNAKGGALYLDSSSNSAHIIQSSGFTSNSISASGASTSSISGVSGGAVHSATFLTETRNTYTGNSVFFSRPNLSIDVQGGALYSVSTLTSRGSTYSRNRATSVGGNAGGGAVATKGFLSVSSSTFTSNTAVSNCRRSCSSSRSGGGAIFNNFGSSITSSAFISNTHQSTSKSAASSGGAIFFVSSSSSLSHRVSFCSFSRNSATSTLGRARGGGIYSYTVSGISQVNSSTFNENSAIGQTSDGGAACIGGGPLSLANATFIQNSAMASAGNANGGALSISGSQKPTSSLFLTLFNYNKAVSSNIGYASGGAIFYAYSSAVKFPILPLSYATFNGNEARAKIGANGGSVFIKGGQSMVFSYSAFYNGNAFGAFANGGGIYGGNNVFISFCKGNTVSSSNYVNPTGKASKLNAIFTGSSPTVKFCPTNPLPSEPNPTFTPTQNCDECNCSVNFNPCHYLSTCTRSANPAATTCACPSTNPGDGFSCKV